MEYFRTPGGIPGFGDWSKIIGELDPFRDGKAASRWVLIYSGSYKAMSGVWVEKPSWPMLPKGIVRFEVVIK